MKIYSIICDLNKPILKQVTVAPYSQFKLALKAVKNGTELSPDEISIAGYDADEELYHGFKTFPFTSETSDLVLDISVENQKFQYVIRVSDATVFDMTPGSKYQIQTLEVTENGTYDEEGKAYSPVNVKVGIPELDCSNYVQDHLVHQYDCYENGGKGVHKIGLQNELMDLAGSADMTAAFPYNCSSTITTAGRDVQLGTTTQDGPVAPCTLEFVMQVPIANTFLVACSLSKKKGIQIGYTSSVYSFAPDNGLTGRYSGINLSNGIHTFTVTYFGDLANENTLYIDGQATNYDKGNVASNPHANICMLYRNSINCYGFYTMRIYDKVLSDQEIMANYQIDKQRFNF